MEDLFYGLDVEKQKKSIKTLEKNLEQIGSKSLLKEIETTAQTPNIYAKSKINTGTEGYIESNITRQQTLAKFRTGTYPITIETGRYTRQPQEERTCPYCINAIEDEPHFLVECLHYSRTREQLFHEFEDGTSINLNSVDTDDKLFLLLNITKASRGVSVV